MQIEYSYDTSDFVKGIIFTKSLLGTPYSKIAEELDELGYPIHQTTVSSIIRDFEEGIVHNNSQYCGR